MRSCGDVRRPRIAGFSPNARRDENRIVDAAASEMVSTIQSDSCAQFAATLKRRKSGTSSAGGMMKRDPAARARFVNKVAGPLLNKMIDCDLLPNR
jgi:hypothetical protein